MVCREFVTLKPAWKFGGRGAPETWSRFFVAPSAVIFEYRIRASEIPFLPLPNTIASVFWRINWLHLAVATLSQIWLLSIYKLSFFNFFVTSREKIFFARILSRFCDSFSRLLEQDWALRLMSDSSRHTLFARNWFFASNLHPRPHKQWRTNVEIGQFGHERYCRYTPRQPLWLIGALYRQASGLPKGSPKNKNAP